MKEVELINKRKPREKHFLREDGTIVAKIYNSNIHYLKNGKYEEIDNTLIKKNSCYTNKSNEYKVKFPGEVSSSIMKMEKDNYYLDIKLVNAKRTKAQNKKKVSKYISELAYKDILDNIDIKYQNLPTKVKETIILNSKKYKRLIFDIFTNLQLIERDNSIIALEQDQAIFTIEKPYMQDSNGNKNTNIYYNLSKKNGYYNLELILDKKWLTSKDTKFPVYIDPTITNESQSTGLCDTYIYQGDTGIDKSSQDVLKAGIEQINGSTIENKTLIKFDLPEIGTGSQVVGASIILTGYLPSNNHDIAEPKLASIHRITGSWNENEATWDSMNQCYDSKVESIFECYRSSLNGSILLPTIMYGDITNVVKKWYNGEDNHGILIQSVKKEYIDADYQAFFSKNNTIEGGDPKPLIAITYRNQNGLEDYLDFQIQGFTDGTSYINTFNGNMTTSFNIGNTVGGVLPVSLNLIYNTNDIVLANETFFGKGYRLNLEQTIKEVTIGEGTYLEYIDEDGTIHYFYQKEVQSNNYFDEDGLNLIIEKSESKCILKDKYNNSTMNFILINGIYQLNEINDSEGNVIIIEFDSNNRINKIKDKYNEEVTIMYEFEKITIISPDKTTTLDLNNNIITSIETIMGTTDFEYNNNGLISSITDVTGLKLEYEYYDKAPYRMKKVTQYGMNSTIGQYFTLEYGFNTTIITDNNGKTQNIIYNSEGNVLSRNSLKTNEDINGAYSIIKNYGFDSSYNKIISSQAPITYIKNYLKNTSFEQATHYFTPESGIESEISTDYSNYGNNSLKIVSQIENKCMNYSINVPKGNFYTFSGYFKNDNIIEISLSYTNSEGNEITSSELIKAKEKFEREDVTIFYEENATSRLNIKVKLVNIGTTYLDNIQLENGEVANLYNFIENSDFSEGYTDWSCGIVNQELTDSTFNVVNFNNGENTALKVSMDPIYGSSFNKSIPINGKKGDFYTISFWYKNEGISAYRPHGGNYVVIYFHPVDGEAEYCFIESPNFNSNDNIWQYFSHSDYALEDFDEINISFVQQDQANDFYITNISLFHNVTSGFYEYDESGNLISAETQENELNTFLYDSNNQLVKATTPKGNNFKYEYDITKPQRLLNAISSGGMSNKIKYDLNGNPINTKIEKLYTTDINNGNFKIRAKGTNKYLKAELNLVLLEENSCSNTIWTLEKNIDVGDYEIRYTANPSYLISCDNGSVSLANSKEKSIYLEQNDDSSYYIAVLTDSGLKYLKALENQLTIDTLDLNDSAFRFYIELPNEKLLESNVEYTENGRFVNKTIDSKLNKCLYETNQTNGQIEKVIKPNNLEILYTYNSKRQPVSIATGEKLVTYEYGTKNEIKKISSGNLSYNINYNDFLKTKTVKINDVTTLIENGYNNQNGNLTSLTYGNGQSILFDYDEFGRIANIETNNNIFQYKYDNNGNISKVLSNNQTSKYIYDVANRIVKYKQGDYAIDYIYDSNNNIIRKNYILNEHVHSVNNTLNLDDIIIQKEYDSHIINYQYDELYRLTNTSINNIYNMTNEYVSYGKRATEVIKRICNGSNSFDYKYDESNNITDILYNEQQIKKYYYNQYNELIAEEDYTTNIKNQYQYDLFGNILSKTTINMNDNSVLNSILYSYENNNWRDQLSKYDSTLITYDNVGNPIKVGENINLTWGNGHELAKYEDISKSLAVEFDYNQNGIRTKKIVNGIVTNYYLENDRIIYEQTDNNILYFMRDKDNLIGFKYNESTYFYEKNIQGNIIAILDNNCNKIVEYEYDSWGNVITISDNTEQKIGEINPYRYRSYYYDKETGLYYLNSRYYNPIWGRFISPDSCIGLNGDHIGYNLYTYVSNNPINNIDPNGRFFKKAWNWVKKKASQIKKKIESVLNITKSTNDSKKKKNNTKNKSNAKKTSSPTKTKEKNDDSGANFVAEIGGGVGGSISINSVELGAYQDITYGYSGDEGFYQNITGSGGIGVGIISGNKSFTHEYPFPEGHPGFEHTPFDTLVIPNCASTETTYSIGALIFDYDTDGTLFIGIDANIHLIFGLHIKIGFEI